MKIDLQDVCGLEVSFDSDRCDLVFGEGLNSTSYCVRKMCDLGRAGETLSKTSRNDQQNDEEKFLVDFQVTDRVRSGLFRARRQRRRAGRHSQSTKSTREIRKRI